MNQDIASMPVSKPNYGTNHWPDCCRSREILSCFIPYFRSKKTLFQPFTKSRSLTLWTFNDFFVWHLRNLQILLLFIIFFFNLSKLIALSRIIKLVSISRVLSMFLKYIIIWRSTSLSLTFFWFEPLSLEYMSKSESTLQPLHNTRSWADCYYRVAPYL